MNFWSKKIQPKDPFEGLAITQAAKYQAERGKRPVLFLSFKDIKALTWESAFQAMQILLADLVNGVVEEHATDLLTANKQDILGKIGRRQANKTESAYTLKILTELLNTQCGEKAWVLIDEYDTPMQSAYQHGFYEEMRDLMRGLLGMALKDNDCLHQSVITGIVRVAKEDIFSGLNNLGTYGVLEKKFAKHFGFTQEEVNALLEQKGLGKHQAMVKRWYNGYQFGDHTIYNPWSIINFVNSEDPMPKLYWVNTSTNHLVHQLLTQADAEVKQTLHTFLQHPTGYTILQKLYPYVPLSEMEDDPNNIWSILLASGYLTANVPRKAEIGDATEALLRFPNKEVRCLYEGLIDRWVQRKYKGFSGATLIRYLLNNDLESFSDYFPVFFRESVSYFDTGGNQPEKFYHGFVVGMLQHLHNEYSVLSQRESGVGRYDLALLPKDKTQPGCVFEFKRSLKKGTPEEVQAQLEVAAGEALQQIKTQGYADQLFQAGVQQVHIVGLAFCGKEVYVVFETLNVS